MQRKRFLHPTLAGLCSVVIWGIAVPVVKIVENQIGLLAFLGLTYALIALFGWQTHILRGRSFPSSIFRNRWLYARWLFFVLHEGLLATGVALVGKSHMPFLVLINYLWPTAVIVCSVMLATVSITRWWAFVLGSTIVLLSLFAEVVGPSTTSSGLFSRPADCWAYVLVLFGALSWGMYSALSRREGDGSGGTAVLPLFQATLGLALPFSLLPGWATWTRLAPASAALLVGYCFLLYLSYAAWDFGMREGNVVILSLLADLIPWLSLLSTSMLLHVAIGREAVFSAIALVLGAGIARYGTLSKAKLPAAYEEAAI